MWKYAQLLFSSFVFVVFTTERGSLQQLSCSYGASKNKDLLIKNFFYTCVKFDLEKYTQIKMQDVDCLWKESI